MLLCSSARLRIEAMDNGLSTMRLYGSAIAIVSGVYSL